MNCNLKLNVQGLIWKFLETESTESIDSLRESFNRQS